VRICQIVPSLEERHGGPSKSVRRLAEALARLGHEVDLLATQPGSASDPSRTDGLRVLQFRRDRPEFLCASSGLRDHLLRNRYDCVHHHALWLRTLHYAGRGARGAGGPLVISPRGMLSDWAWRHRRWKKWLAARLVHPGAFRAARGWHATSTTEADDIRRHGFQQPVCLAPNGVEAPDGDTRKRSCKIWSGLWPAVTARRVALFYSRFHRKKRLLELIDLWAAAAPGDWLLLIAGIPQEYSVEELGAYVQKHSAGERIRVVDAGSQPPPYGVASVFLLPSHSENFGMVIAEAMAWGVPAMVTDTTPWAAMAEQDAGWCVPWAEYEATLRKVLAEPDDQLARRGGRARDWVLAHCSWEQTARLLAEFYEGLRKPKHED
jgi:glycosyltransferase involved in cell wall biosynthesis